MMSSSVVDLPIADNTDSLGIKAYEKALVKFIEGAGTPLTIALQGEWGSGKTSLMNSLKNTLVGENKLFHGIWLNTWQHSIIAKGDLAVIGILKSIVYNLTEYIPAEGRKKVQLSMGLKLFKVSAMATANIAGGLIGLKNVGTVFSDVAAQAAEAFSQETGLSEIAELKKEIQNVMGIITSTHKKRFLFFIDDLDRIDPTDAVVILELLKNIFDLPGCIFVLAIDYGVVIKGLKPKFGEMTPENEREFRSFFDKIIQLPFSMPVGAYKIDAFLLTSLQQVGFLNEADIKNDKIIQNLSIFARLSVGTNPRSLKRLANALSLIRLMMDEQPRCEGEELPDQFVWRDKVIIFALVCIQICYPPIYMALQSEPDFKGWGKTLMKKLSLRKLSSLEEQKIGQQDEFNDEWERVLYLLCVKDTFLYSRVFDVSLFLNSIAKLFKEGEEDSLQETLERIIGYSSVTSVSFGVSSTEVGKVPIPDRSSRLNTHCWRLIDRTNAKLGNWGKLKCVSKRTVYKVQYAIDQANKHDFCKNANNYLAWLEHDGRSFCFTWGTKSFRIFAGAVSSVLAEEESKLNKAGICTSIKRDLDDKLKHWCQQFEPSCEIKYQMDNTNGGWAHVTVILRYENLDDFTRDDYIESFACFLVDFFKITDRFAEISKAQV